jgi:steroid delta-isomerase-like uncharacterized protein
MISPSGPGVRAPAGRVEGAAVRAYPVRMTRREGLEEVARQWISLWCVPVDWGLFDRLHDDAFVDASPAGRPADKAGLARGLAELVRAFPDLQTWVEDLVVDVRRSMVAVRWAARGTNRERFLGIGPTERETPITGIEIVEIRDGRIVRRWGQWDISGHREELQPAS